jgi:hypothetical protein
LLLASTLAPALLLVTDARSQATEPPPKNDDLVQVLKDIDERQNSSGDWRAVAYMEQKEKGKADTVYEATFMRRPQGQQFLMLFTKPKTSQGQGYLRSERNLWFYNPSVGKWERRTERERIGGTNSRRSDFDESRLAQEYDPENAGPDQLGAYKAQVIKLKGKPGLDLSFPTVKIWVDVATKNILKRQEFALSGRLLRTAYFPKWKKVYSDHKKKDVWYAEEIRFFDEMEKANSTLVILKSVDLKPLEANIFTKAWLESQSR